ncbi:MAG: SPOR domain-containing protein [Desulfobacteraceae bacterium]
MKNKNRYITCFLFVCLLVMSASGQGSSDQKNSENIRKIFDKGVSEFKQGRYQKAVDLFTEMIFKGVETPLVYKNRGISLLCLKEFDLAIKDFKTAIRLNQNIEGLYNNLGSAWHYKKKYTRAIACYDQEISNWPEGHTAYFNRAISLVELDRKEEAVKDLDKCLDLKPGFKSALLLKNEILGRSGTESDIKSKAGEKPETDEHSEKNEKPEADKHPETDEKIKKNKKPCLETEKAKYTVQTGAFLNPDNAASFKADLVQKGLEAKILILHDVKKRKWYLVRIGGYETRGQALKFLDWFNAHYKINAVIRPVGEF